LKPSPGGAARGLGPTAIRSLPAIIRSCDKIKE
jgi:hypothetical protein